MMALIGQQETTNPADDAAGFIRFMDGFQDDL